MIDTRRTMFRMSKGYTHSRTHHSRVISLIYFVDGRKHGIDVREDSVTLMQPTRYFSSRKEALRLFDDLESQLLTEGWQRLAR